MGTWFKQFESLIWAASIALCALAYCYDSFATKEYVNQKHDSVMDVLKDLREEVQTIDERTYQLNGESGPAPKHHRTR
jgi:hypothetical protein